MDKMDPVVDSNPWDVRSEAFAIAVGLLGRYWSLMSMAYHISSDRLF